MPDTDTTAASDTPHPMTPGGAEPMGEAELLRRFQNEVLGWSQAPDHMSSSRKVDRKSAFALVGQILRAARAPSGGVTREDLARIIRGWDKPPAGQRIGPGTERAIREADERADAILSRLQSTREGEEEPGARGEMLRRLRYATLPDQNGSYALCGADRAAIEWAIAALRPATQPDAPARPEICKKDRSPCYVGGDEPHWRCGTSACGKASARPVADGLMDQVWDALQVAKDTLNPVVGALEGAAYAVKEIDAAMAVLSASTGQHSEGDGA